MLTPNGATMSKKETANLIISSNSVIHGKEANVSFRCQECMKRNLSGTKYLFSSNKPFTMCVKPKLIGICVMR